MTNIYEKNNTLCRPLWRRLTFSSNVRLDLNGFFFEEFTWNIPIQMQFYLLFPLVILALRGPLSKRPSAELSRKTLRHRLATACGLSIVASALYKAAVVIHRDVPDPLPMLAYLDPIPGSGGHSTKDVHAAFDWLNWLHSAFLARCTDFSLGTLIYLITSSEEATRALRARPWVCNGVTAVCSALGFVACFPRAVAPISLRPSDNIRGPLAQSLIVVVGIQGLLVPISAAWLLLYALVQPGGVSRYAASFLGSRRWDWLAARSYSVFLLHTLVTLLLFKLLPITSLIGPLEELHTYLMVCGLVLGISTVTSWLLDNLIAAAMSSRRKAAGMASKKVA